MLEEIGKYRQLVTLNDGARVLLRPLVKEDRDALLEFFAPVTRDDMKFLRNDVTNREMVVGWAENVDYRRVLPLLAVMNGRIIGDASLHFRGPGPARHIADVRIFLHKEFRRRGLGTAMLRSLIDLARKFGLQQLVAEIVADQLKVIHAFESLGFEQRALYRDYFMMPDGETHDVAVLILSLVTKKEEF